jgi:Lar family restriction alleviation protein
MADTAAVVELKPCPFCGHDPVITPPMQYGPEISCERCGLLMSGQTRKQLVARWNLRVFRIAQAPGVIPEAFRDGK